MHYLRIFHHLNVVNCAGNWQVKATHLADQCSCAGAFKNTISPAEFERGLQVFLNIAKYHGFELLEEVVTWLVTPLSNTSS